MGWVFVQVRRGVWDGAGGAVVGRGGAIRHGVACLRRGQRRSVRRYTLSRMSGRVDISSRAEQIDVVRRFAAALDAEAYEAAEVLLDGDCMYRIRGETIRGSGAIVGSYRGNGDTAARVFDEIAYGSEVRGGEDGWVVIRFWDRITHRSERLEHVCEQWVRVGASGRIERIEHRDLPGERERLAVFRARFGL